MNSTFSPPNIDIEVTGAKEALALLDELTESVSRAIALIAKLSETHVGITYTSSDGS